MAVAKEWFVQIQGKQYGPVTSSVLKDSAAGGKVRPETLVRLGRDGKWVPASRVKGLFQPPESLDPVSEDAVLAMIGTPPPTPVLPANQTEISSSSEVEQYATSFEKVRGSSRVVSQIPVAPRRVEIAAAKPVEPEVARRVPNTSAGQREYKVLTQKDKWLSRKFDPASIEAALNSYLQEGWCVVACATATFPGFLSANREEMVVVLERAV